jgi:outer membrane lipoprotein LolB
MSRSLPHIASLVFLVAALVAGCATPLVSTPERTYSGRFSASAIQAGQRENVSGRFVLQVRGAHRTLDLSTPLGSTMARIEVTPDGARATGAQMQEVRGPDAEALAEQLLGWRLPVDGLADWLEARPGPGGEARVERENGRVVRMEQDGWTIEIPEIDGQTLQPRILIFKRPAAPFAPAVDLRLVVETAAG